MPPSISKFSRYEVNKLFNTVSKKKNIFGLTFLASPKSNSTARILVVTPKKCGCAAKRNRIRRRLKSLFLNNGFLEKEFDIAVIVRKEGIEKNYKELEQDLVEFVNAISK